MRNPLGFDYLRSVTTIYGNVITQLTLWTWQMLSFNLASNRRMECNVEKKQWSIHYMKDDIFAIKFTSVVDLICTYSSFVPNIYLIYIHYVISQKNFHNLSVSTSVFSVIIQRNKPTTISLISSLTRGCNSIHPEGYMIYEGYQ